MSNRAHPHTAAGRVSARELARIDAAARLTGANRSVFVRRSVIAAADQVLKEHGREDQKRRGDEQGPPA